MDMNSLNFVSFSILRISYSVIGHFKLLSGALDESARQGIYRHCWFLFINPLAVKTKR